MEKNQLTKYIITKRKKVRIRKHLVFNMFRERWKKLLVGIVAQSDEKGFIASMFLRAMPSCE